MNLIITCYWSLVSALSSCPGHPLVLRNLAKGSPWSETAWPDLNLGHKIHMLRLPFPWLDTSLCRYVVFTFHVLSVFEKFTKTMSDKWPKFPFSLALHWAETFLTVWKLSSLVLFPIYPESLSNPLYHLRHQYRQQDAVTLMDWGIFMTNLIISQNFWVTPPRLLLNIPM